MQVLLVKVPGHLRTPSGYASGPCSRINSTRKLWIFQKEPESDFLNKITIQIYKDPQVTQTSFSMEVRKTSLNHLHTRKPRERVNEQGGNEWKQSASSLEKYNKNIINNNTQNRTGKNSPRTYVRFNFWRYLHLISLL